MPKIDPKDIPLLLEAIEELLYKVSLQLQEFKGGPLTTERRELTEKQRRLEAIQHELLQPPSPPQEST
jgi:hypothetical protein